MDRSRPVRWLTGWTLACTLAACGGGGGGPTAPEAPVIENLQIQGSIRAGEDLVIRGRGLSGALSPRALSAAAAVVVLLDGEALTPLSTTATEIRVRIPLDLEPGPHTLSVRVDGRTSNSVTFTVEIFTTTGTYRGPGRIALATCNDPAVEAQLQQLFPPGATGEGTQAVRDERPDLTMVSVNFSDNAVITGVGQIQADGTFHVVVDDNDPDVVSEKTGRFSAEGERVTLDSVNTITLDADGLLCVVEIEFTEERFTTEFQIPTLPPGTTARVIEALRGLAR